MYTIKNPFAFFIRLLMRREQILKICLNHALTADIIFKEKDDKSWMWAARDYSEEDGKKETFVIRFRDAEISKSFMAAVRGTKVRMSFISRHKITVYFISNN